MQVTINGEASEAEEGLSLVALIEQLQLSGRRLAVEINGRIVPRSEHAQTRLAAGDRVEIVQAIGGG